MRLSRPGPREQLCLPNLLIGTRDKLAMAWGRSDVFCCCIDDDNSTCFDDQDTVVTYSISTLVLFTSTRTLAVSASAVTETVHLTHRVSDGCPRTTRRGSLTSPGSGFMLWRTRVWAFRAGSGATHGQVHWMGAAARACVTAGKASAS
ncbi:hypothetical protein S40285_10152 [Stachybotrys chlorohalonatus IBT 40285]|uniref:Uncharacterized protein n=1 Tax=Stachybotrys chlorohalonatus (strain IBT 40285) TaxID=1283841 RepID=A0A084R182_STAC4|nr:hypothetical protein S40285_10152 [Stachybotrys chlorohalonata IBT 40285]